MVKRKADQAGTTSPNKAIKASVTLAPKEEQELREPYLDLSTWEMISQGAEAKVWAGTFLGRPAVVKQRFSKKYRNPVLDFRLNTARVKQEVRGLQKAHKVGVHVPGLYMAELEAGTLYMERIQGRPLKRALLDHQLSQADQAAVAGALGRQVALMHDSGLVHGDLTTSNFLLQEPGNTVVCIDFGLSSVSSIAEDKAVDLYVLERAFSSLHPDIPDMWDKVLEAYKASSRMWSATLNKFAEVRMRGRKRVMVG